MKCSDSRMLLTSRVGTKNPAQFYPPGFIWFYPAEKNQKNPGSIGFEKKKNYIFFMSPFDLRNFLMKNGTVPNIRHINNSLGHFFWVDHTFYRSIIIYYILINYIHRQKVKRQK